MDIILIAGLKNGRMIADYFMQSDTDTLLKVYVLKDEFGKNISDFVTFDDIIPEETLVKVEHIKNHEDEIVGLNPDYIFVVGWSQLVSKRIFESAKKCCIGFHPSKLPADRGRSVLAWQISEGYKEGCVSMFQIDSGVDSGKIIGQLDYEINYEDTVKDVLENVYLCCLQLTQKFFPLLKTGNIEFIVQDEKKSTYRPLRQSKDGVIDWNKNSVEIYNLIRALTYPYPLASTCYHGQEIKIIKAIEAQCPHIYSNQKPGTILEIHSDNGLLIKTRDGAILIVETVDTSAWRQTVSIGDFFE